MVRVGYARVGFALGIYISCWLFPVPSHWVAKANAISGGISLICCMRTRQAAAIVFLQPSNKATYSANIKSFFKVLRFLSPTFSHYRNEVPKEAEA